jgi:hypothetical protein
MRAWELRRLRKLRVSGALIWRRGRIVECVVGVWRVCQEDGIGMLRGGRRHEVARGWRREPVVVLRGHVVMVLAMERTSLLLVVEWKRRWWRQVAEMRLSGVVLAVWTLRRLRGWHDLAEGRAGQIVWGQSAVPMQHGKQWVRRRFLNGLRCLDWLRLGRKAQAHAEQPLELRGGVGGALRGRERRDLGQCIARTLAPAHVCNQCREARLLRQALGLGRLVGRGLAQVCLQALGVCDGSGRRRCQKRASRGPLPVLPSLELNPGFERAQERCDHVEVVVLDQVLAGALLDGLVLALEGWQIAELVPVDFLSPLAAPHTDVDGLGLGLGPCTDISFLVRGSKYVSMGTPRNTYSSMLCSRMLTEMLFMSLSGRTRPAAFRS